MQALEVLKKAKVLSKKHYNDFSLLTIIELEKLIQSRHITRSKSEPISELITESTVLSNRVKQRIELSNVRIKLHTLYIQQGHIESKEKEKELTRQFESALSGIDEQGLEGMEQIYYYQSYVWYHYILDQFDQCKTWAQKWVEAFDNSQELQRRDVDLYMRGYHYVLTSCFNIKDITTYESTLTKLEVFRKTNYKKLNHNSQIISFQYVHNGRMNLHFLKGTFNQGLNNIPNTLNRIKRYAKKLDAHKVMIIHYKISWMYIGAGIPQKAIKYLDFIIALTDKSLREDIQCYARLMKIIALYDLERYNDVLDESDIFIKFFERMKHSNKVQFFILNTLKILASAPIFDRKEILIQSLKELKLLKEKNYERRAFIYLDILPWVESKIRRIGIGEVIEKQSL